jgi:hypothetical protein
MEAFKRFFWMIVFILTIICTPGIIIGAGYAGLISLVEFLLIKLGAKISQQNSISGINHCTMKKLNKEGTLVVIKYYIIPEGGFEWLKRFIGSEISECTKPIGTGNKNEEGKNFYVQFFKNEVHFNMVRTSNDYSIANTPCAAFIVDFYRINPEYNYARVFVK